MYVLIDPSQALIAANVLGYARYHLDTQGDTTPLSAIIFGEIAQETQTLLGQYGVTKAISVGTETTATPQTQAAALRKILEQADTCQLVVAQSVDNDILLGKLSIFCNAAAVSKVNSPLTKHDKGYTVQRSIYTGKAIETRLIIGNRFLLSITNNILENPVTTEATTPQIQSLDQTPIALPWEVSSNQQAAQAVLLPDADIVVSGGRGMQGAENWSILEDLAQQLGAALACSKPVSDMEWRPHHEHVGQTGIKISPKLYIAVGISGAIQHLAGVSSSQVIVVINKDAEAPFFKAADYGIVGDALEIVPQLTQELKNRPQ